MPYLRMFREQEGTREAYLKEERTLVGRSISHADIVISDSTVSRVHASIHHKDGHYIIQDERSTSGTVVNSQRVTKALLNHGDTISLAGCIMEFRTDDQETPSSGIDLEHPLVQKMLENFRLLPSAMRMRYRALDMSAGEMFSAGDTLSLSGCGILLPTRQPLREYMTIEMEFTNPQNKRNFILGEINAIIPFKNMQAMCIKLHKVEPEDYEYIMRKYTRGVWCNGWPLNQSPTIHDIPNPF